MCRFRVWLLIPAPRKIPIYDGYVIAVKQDLFSPFFLVHVYLLQMSVLNDSSYPGLPFPSSSTMNHPSPPQMGHGIHCSQGMVKSNPLFPAFGESGTYRGQGSSLERSQVHFSPVPLHRHGIHSMFTSTDAFSVLDSNKGSCTWGMFRASYQNFAVSIRARTVCM